MVLLLGAVYKCSHADHIVYSTDPFMLQRLNTAHIPFILLHRTGFTVGFVQCVVNLAHEGLSMQSIRRHIEAIQHQYVVDIILGVVADYRICTDKELLPLQIQSISSSNIVDLISHPIPSNDIIGRYFTITFQENEHFYTS